MSQAHVTDFFSTRKRTNGGNPSKRRKLGSAQESTEAFSIQDTNTIRSESVKINVNIADKRPENALPEAKLVVSTKTKNSIKKILPKHKTVSNQPLLRDILNSGASNCSSEKDDYRRAMMEEVTSAWDEHDGPLLTPSKRHKDPDDTDITQGSKKRTRCGSKKLEFEQTPVKNSEARESSTVIESKARKQLILQQVVEGSNAHESSKTETSSIVSGKNLDIPMSPRLMKTIEKVRLLGSTEKKLAADKMKDKLQKCGRLEEIKAQLSQMSKNVADLKKLPKLEKFETVIVEQPVVTKAVPASPVKPTAPAYERFHSLATPGAPTLSLPYRYKLLAEMFRNCDTVVSMLHNRAEVCTFSKLKTAVQTMSKRNFEENNLGQIHTVYPTAYKLRQEKGLAGFGKKITDYQLTVEANLHQSSETAAESYKTRQTFTLQNLTERKNIFCNKLLSIVKRCHKEFLSKLDRPLNVPDDKITRWHPKFRLDEVPDIEPAELPQPPNVQVYQTAKDVLENARGKVLPNVERALENVSSKKEVPVKPVEQAKCETNEVKGIPQSLLEKIRAKEAARMEAAMMRDPVEDKRLKMLQKLPEMMRILRAQFVQEKKPALLKSDIVQKLSDSCRSSIAMGDVETHLNLMLEMLPRWLQQVEIKKGKYIKMDRNIELQDLITQINNAAKS